MNRAHAAVRARYVTPYDRELRRSIGRQVKEQRERAGIAPAELADASGIDRATLEAVERGACFESTPIVRIAIGWASAGPGKRALVLDYMRAHFDACEALRVDPATGDDR